MNNSPDRTTLRTWFAFGLRLLGFWEILTAAGTFLTGLNIVLARYAWRLDAGSTLTIAVVALPASPFRQRSDVSNMPTHVYEVRSRKDKRGVDLVSDALPFGRCRW